MGVFSLWPVRWHGRTWCAHTSYQVVAATIMENQDCEDYTFCFHFYWFSCCNLHNEHQHRHNGTTADYYDDEAWWKWYKTGNEEEIFNYNAEENVHSKGDSKTIDFHAVMHHYASHGEGRQLSWSSSAGYITYRITLSTFNNKYAYNIIAEPPTHPQPKQTRTCWRSNKKAKYNQVTVPALLAERPNTHPSFFALISNTSIVPHTKGSFSYFSYTDCRWRVICISKNDE